MMHLNFKTHCAMIKTIKSILLSAVAAMALSSCAHNEINAPVSQESQFSYTFSLSLDSKAVIGDDSIEYEAGDALGVFAPGTVNSKSTVDVTANPVTVGVKTTAALQNGDKVYAYYPYSAANASVTATNVTLEIPSQQSQEGASYDADAMPMVSLPYVVDGAIQAGATKPVGQLFMCNLGAIAEFNIYGSAYASETIQSVSFLSENVAGEFTFDLTSVADEEDLVIEGADRALVKTVVSQNLKVGSTKDGASKVYMVLTPGAHKGVLTITTSAAIYTYDLETAIQFNRSKVRPVNVNLANAQRTTQDVLTIIKNAGYNPDYYMPLELEWHDLAYYNSASDYDAMVTTANNSKQFVCTQIFEKAQIPNGSLVVVTSGYKYRPDGWVALNQLNGSKGNGLARPDNISTSLAVVDDAWWSTWNYRAFNISNSSGSSLSGATEAARNSFAVFVPKLNLSTSSLTEIIAAAGYNPSDYTQLEIDYTDFAYYNSQNSSQMNTLQNSSWNSTIDDFVATPIYTRDDLPDGTLIVQKSGYMYRPEGWSDLSSKNTSSKRPGNVTTNVVQVDASWWADWNYRAFNLAFEDRTPLAPNENATETLCPQVRAAFGIFIPKQKVEINSIKILAIGNSFSVDAMEYLYGILKDVGYDKITLGNLYIGGCTLETHSGHFQSNNTAYTYYVNTSGAWSSTSSYRPLDALDSQKWDIITMQQGSPKSGLPDSFDPYLGNLINIVKSHCPSAELVWHMTWAYQANSTHSGFANYSNNQMTMYNAIVSTVQSKILTNSNFSKVIPNGTAVQNMRTSFVGDNLTRDGYHMSYDKGRYLTALTFAKALTGCDLTDVTYTPSSYTYTEKEILAMKDAADKACATPYAVTASAYPPDDNEFDYSAATCEQILAHEGYDVSAYTKMQIPYTKFAYYNSGNATMLSTLYTADNKSVHNQTNYVRFVATPIYQRTDIPNGTVIIIKPGSQYRPEGWTDLNVKNGTASGNSGYSRPDNVTTTVVQVNDTWWGAWNYRAFNLSYVVNTNLTDATADNLISDFAVFIPNR